MIVKRKYNPMDVVAIETALERLHAAREHLKIAKAPKAGAYVRRAIKSAEGALRHAELRKYAQFRQGGA